MAMLQPLLDSSPPPPSPVLRSPAVSPESELAAGPDHDDPTTPMPDVDADEPEPTIAIPVAFAGRTQTFHLPAHAVLDDLTQCFEEAFGLDYDWLAHKLIAPPPTGLLKPAQQPDLPLAPLAGTKLRLLAAKHRDVSALREAAQSAARRRDRRRARHHAAAASASGGGSGVRRTRPTTTAAADAQYTFLQLRALPDLPRPERSLAYLERLRADPGVRAAMRAHRFAVPLLTEMEPLAHTHASHEGTERILGLNRNAGEVIELRLRTDAYDGYRDYRTVRRTLCHELAHNVHGPHDRHFWDLCHQIEREVERAGQGHTLAGPGEMYNPPPERVHDDDDDDEVMDHGGWTGGEFVLGGSTPGQGLSRKEILAKAAEERLRKMDHESRGPGSGSGAPGRDWQLMYHISL